MTGLKTFAVGDNVAAHQLNDEFARKIVRAKYNFKKSSSQSNMIPGRYCDPVGYAQPPRNRVFPANMPFAGVVVRNPLDGIFRISEFPESVTIGLHGHDGVPLNMCAVVFRITDIVASQVRDVIQTLHVRIPLVRLETHHLVAEFAQVFQMTFWTSARRPHCCRRIHSRDTEDGLASRKGPGLVQRPGAPRQGSTSARPAVSAGRWRLPHQAGLKHAECRCAPQRDGAGA